MSESATTTPPPVETPPPAPDPAAEEVLRIAGEAQKSHSLKDRLRGAKMTRRKIVVFTDGEAVERYADAERRIAGVEAVMNPELADDADEDERATYEELIASLRQRHDAIEQQRDAARQDMLASALAIHLRAVPQPVMKMAVQAANKAYALGDGTVPDEAKERWEEKRSRYVLGRVIEKVVAVDGEMTFDRDQIAQDLEEGLDLVQWSRVLRAFSEIVYTDQIGDAATTDPGF